MWLHRISLPPKTEKWAKKWGTTWWVAIVNSSGIEWVWHGSWWCGTHTKFPLICLRGNANAKRVLKREREAEERKKGCGGHGSFLFFAWGAYQYGGPEAFLVYWCGTMTPPPFFVCIFATIHIGIFFCLFNSWFYQNFICVFASLQPIFMVGVMSSTMSFDRVM